MHNSFHCPLVRARQAAFTTVANAAVPWLPGGLSVDRVRAAEASLEMWWLVLFHRAPPYLWVRFGSFSYPLSRALHKTKWKIPEIILF